MMGWGNGMGGWGWLLMTGSWVLLIVAVVAAIAWLLPRDSRDVVTGRDPEPSGLLERRLATGEIDLATYRALRAGLADSDLPRL